MKAVRVFQDKTNIHKTVKKTMKESIQHKLPTEALLDKENVTKPSLENSNTEVTKKTVAATVSTVDKKDLKDLTKNDKIEVEKNIESASSKTYPESEKRIIAEDLTSKKPTIEYYKKLVQHRNKLLNAALEEKEYLKEKNELLIEENKSLKEALIAATDVIDTLNDILEDEKVDESSNTSDIKTEIDESVPVPTSSNTDGSSKPFPSNDSTLVHDSDDSIVQ